MQLSNPHLTFAVDNFPLAHQIMPIPLATRSIAWVRGRSVPGVAGSNPAGRCECLSVVSVVCCQVEVSATGKSLFPRSPTGCGVSEWDFEVR